MMSAAKEGETEVPRGKLRSTAANGASHNRPPGELILQSLRLPIVVLDRELAVISANHAFRDRFVPAGEQLEGLAFAEVCGHEWDAVRIHQLLEQLAGAVAEHTEICDFELEHRDSWLRIDCSWLDQAEAGPLLLLTIDDVTPLRAAQAAALQCSQELEREHRRKDEFLAMLGHELRNPLAALVNGLSLLEHVGCDAKQFEKIHPMMVRQTRRMTVMLDQLLDISRVSSGRVLLELRPVDLVEVVHSAIEAVQPMIDAGKHQLLLAVPERPALIVSGDVVRLVQVLENLLSNAVKYTNEGGTIWVTLDELDGSARVRVRDTGVGIEAELLPHVFDVFIQGTQNLARAKGGLGLGLALVRQLVDMHGGHVEAFSRGAGQGSEFTVVLPLESQWVARRRCEEDLAHAQPRRVLVVDDERDAAVTLAELLHSYGHDTRVAYDGRTAVDMVRSFAPDVVLLDLGLPDIDGYEVAKRIRAEARRAIRLIAVTGYQRDDVRLREASFDDHVIKPHCLERLAVLLAKP
jgi:two-component system CheB/CheR fusion protein